MRVLSRLAAAVLVTAAAGLALPSPPASAAACSTSSGVTVVVDYAELGGGVQQVCDASGGGDTAASLFTANGFPLTYAQRQPGFVCRVSGEPASDPCVNTSPADAYWGLWWSDGESGLWTYASAGADSLTIPEGGYVAFAWDGSSGQATPGAFPTPHPAEPTPTPTPSTPSPSNPPSSATPSSPGGGHGGPGNDTGGADPTPDPTTSGSANPSVPASDDATGTPTSKPSGTPSDGPSEASESPTPTETPSSPAAVGDSVDPGTTQPGAADDGLPVWITPAMIGLIFIAAGATLWHRRRMSSTR